MGIGGVFDVMAGNLRRAPLWMRNHRLEWRTACIYSRAVSDVWRRFKVYAGDKNGKGKEIKY
ncbi:MAG: WecB/TagA/CpsF family glycosyltransferase [Dialister invisus]